MKSYPLASLLLLTTLLISSCGGNTLVAHPTKSLTDLHIDKKACASLAQAIAKEQSLVRQPNIFVLEGAYSQCMISQGWVPTTSTQQPVAQVDPVSITSSDSSIRFVSNDKQIEFKGLIQLISQQQQGALFKQDDQYIYLNLQYNSPLTFLSTYPELLPEAKVFDKHQDKSTRATFYYMEANDKLIFGCTAYILLAKNSRIVVSVTKELFDMPADFLEISRSEFNQLLGLEAAWKKLITDINEQSRA